MSFKSGVKDRGSDRCRLALVAMATKFDTKSAVIRLVQEMSPRSVRTAGMFWDQAIE